MASAKDIDIKGYCDSMYDELTDMKSRLFGLMDCIDQVEGNDKVKEMVRTHAPHLRDIADTIDWKLQILTKVCPTDWARYPEGAETIVSVKEPERSERESVAGGNVGG